MTASAADKKPRKRQKVEQGPAESSLAAAGCNEAVAPSRETALAAAVGVHQDVPLYGLAAAAAIAAAGGTGGGTAAAAATFFSGAAPPYPGRSSTAGTVCSQVSSPTHAAATTAAAAVGASHGRVMGDGEAWAVKRQAAGVAFPGCQADDIVCNSPVLAAAATAAASEQMAGEPEHSCSHGCRQVRQEEQQQQQQGPAPCRQEEEQQRQEQQQQQKLVGLGSSSWETQQQQGSVRGTVGDYWQQRRGGHTAQQLKSTSGSAGALQRDSGLYQTRHPSAAAAAAAAAAASSAAAADKHAEKDGLVNSSNHGRGVGGVSSTGYGVPGGVVVKIEEFAPGSDQGAAADSAALPGGVSEQTQGQGSQIRDLLQREGYRGAKQLGGGGDDRMHGDGDGEGQLPADMPLLDAEGSRGMSGASGGVQVKTEAASPPARGWEGFSVGKHTGDAQDRNQLGSNMGDDFLPQKAQQEQLLSKGTGVGIGGEEGEKEGKWDGCRKVIGERVRMHSPFASAAMGEGGFEGAGWDPVAVDTTGDEAFAAELGRQQFGLRQRRSADVGRSADLEMKGSKGIAARTSSAPNASTISIAAALGPAAAAAAPAAAAEVIRLMSAESDEALALEVSREQFGLRRRRSAGANAEVSSRSKLATAATAAAAAAAAGGMKSSAEGGKSRGHVVGLGKRQAPARSRAGAMMGNASGGSEASLALPAPVGSDGGFRPALSNAMMKH